MPRETLLETCERLKRNHEKVTKTPLQIGPWTNPPEEEAKGVQAMWRLARNNGEPPWLFGNLLEGVIQVVKRLPKEMQDDPRAMTLMRVLLCRLLTRVWGVTKGVYDFHPEVFRALVATPAEGEIPTQVLEKLPEWCVYLRFPDADTAIAEIAPELVGLSEAYSGDWRAAGVFVYIDKFADGTMFEADKLPDPVVREAAMDSIRRTIHLLFDLHDTDGKQWFDLISMPLASTVEESIGAYTTMLRTVEDTSFDAQARAKEAETIAALMPLLGRVLNLVFYLCAKNAEYGHEEGDVGPVRPSDEGMIRMALEGRKPAGKRLLGRGRGERPVKPWSVGWRIGQRMREADAAEEVRAVGTGTAKRPHVRRAHFHTYRTGAGRTGVDIKWLSPIFVGTTRDAAESELPAVGAHID